MVSVNTVAYQSPQFSVLSESQLEDLHLAALEVLRHTIEIIKEHTPEPLEREVKNQIKEILSRAS